MMKNRDKLLQAMLTARSNVEAFRTAGISDKTGYRYLAEPAFQEELAKARDQAVADAIGKLKGRMDAVANQLIAILESPGTSPQIKINAAQLICNVVKGYTDTVEVQRKLAEIEAGMEERLNG